MAYDANLQLASESAKSGTTTSTGIDLLTGSLRGGVMWARIEVTAGTETGGTNNLTMTFSVSHSSDNSTYYAHTSGADQVVTITAGTATRSRDVVWIPIVTDKRYIQLVMTKGGSGTSTTLAWNAYITNSHPQ